MRKSCVIVQKPECTYIFTFPHAISNYSHCHFAKRKQADMCSEDRLRVPLLKLLAITYKIGEVKRSHLLKKFDYTFICRKYDLTREKAI